MDHDILFPMTQYWWLYLGFVAFVLGMLSLDLGVIHRRAHAVTFREAGVWVLVSVALALLFNVALYIYCLNAFPSHPLLEHLSSEEQQATAREIALEFLTGYIVEQSLAIDNIFVFVVVFSFFRVPAKYQHRVLHLGIIGALLFRGLFIALGSLLLQYKYIVWIFGGFLIVTGARMAFTRHDDIEPGNNFILRWLHRMLPVSRELHEQELFVKQNGRWLATPLFIALIFLEMTDIIFAIDSVPAIFAITQEPLIVFTSNIFAILSLRSLYFVLAGSVHKFHLLKFGLSAVLVFVGLKMVWLNDLYHGEFPIVYSLTIIATCIGGSIAASLLFPLADDSKHVEQTPHEAV